MSVKDIVCLTLLAGCVLVVAWGFYCAYMESRDLREVRVRIWRETYQRRACCGCCNPPPPIHEWVWEATGTIGRGKYAHTISRDWYHFDSWQEAMNAAYRQCHDKNGQYRPKRLFSEITYV